MKAVPITLVNMCWQPIRYPLVVWDPFFKDWEIFAMVVFCVCCDCILFRWLLQGGVIGEIDRFVGTFDVSALRKLYHVIDVH